MTRPHRWTQAGDAAVCAECGAVARAWAAVEIDPRYPEYGPLVRYGSEYRGARYTGEGLRAVPAVCMGDGQEPRHRTLDEFFEALRRAGPSDETVAALEADRRAERASDAFAALAWVLGQVWRAHAWNALLHYPNIEVTIDGQLFEYALRGGPDLDEPWRVCRWIDWNGPVVGELLDFDDARAAALELIARLGDG